MAYFAYLSLPEIMKKMGEVFLLRGNIAAVGSVLDSPEVFWVRYVHLFPLYMFLKSILSDVSRLAAVVRRRAELPRDPATHSITGHACRGSARHALAAQGERGQPTR